MELECNYTLIFMEPEGVVGQNFLSFINPCDSSCPYLRHRYIAAERMSFNEKDMRPQGLESFLEFHDLLSHRNATGLIGNIFE